MREYTLRVSPQQEGRRLDLFLIDFSKENSLGLSRTAAKKLILEGGITHVRLAGLKPHYKIKAHDEFKLCIADKKKQLLQPEAIPLDIVYEDEDLAIIDKQAGLVVHPAPGNYEHTLVNALLFRLDGLSDINPQRPGIVHRLDKETSGLLVVAKNNPAHLALVEQFSAHTIQRKYIAVVKGRMEFDENIIDLPISRHPTKRKNMCVGFTDKSKYAKTHYRTLKRAKDYSLLELKPYTGRTHQLRVHLAFLGHPILGDVKYGRNNEFKRLALHAEYLCFSHPRTGKPIDFFSPAPKEFLRLFSKHHSETKA